MDVVIALILSSDNKLLIAQRGSHQTHAGCWEFPGGKTEPGETHLQALQREIKEEVNIDICSATPFGFTQHQYKDFEVKLNFFLVEEFVGEPYCKEKQKGMRWVSAESLSQYDFPKGNQEIIHKLQQALIIVK